MKPQPTLFAAVLLLLFSSAAYAAATPVADPDPLPAAAAAQTPGTPDERPALPYRYINTRSSTYIPMDSWIYPALDRLSSMGYLDTAYFGLRPWTRMSVQHMLELTADRVIDNGDDESEAIYLAVLKELEPDVNSSGISGEVDSAYLRLLGITGDQPLTDSFNFGQTLINDDGRPYGQGFNAILGGHVRAEAGRFSLNARGEYQHAPGYPALPAAAQAAVLKSNGFLYSSQTDGAGTRDNFRLLDASASFHIWNHEISVGKSEMYWGPNQGGAFLWSANAEPIYMLRINMVEPLRVPFISRLIGPIRWDNYFGKLDGHVLPADPWIFGQKISLHPLPDIEFGFSRSCTFAGKGYHPLTFGEFWKCFASAGDKINSGAPTKDVGDRRASFDFRWRLPKLQHWVTLYADSEADDDPSPLANPNRAGWAPGIYVSHLPGVPHMDLRFEAPFTKTATDAGLVYTNHAYRDGFTNNQYLIGYWIGRQSSGYQGWLTYWLSPREQIQFQYRDAKIDSRLWAGGGTQTDLSGKIVKRLTTDVELNGFFQWERYLIPILKPGAQHDFSTSVQITWYPKIQKQL